MNALLHFTQFLDRTRPRLSETAQNVLAKAEEVRQSNIDRFTGKSDEHVMRQLVGALNSLRYWEHGFDEDDQEAGRWKDFFGQQVSDLLDVLKARGIQ